MQRLHDVRGTAGTDTHVTQTSTGTADVKTFTAPKNAVAVLIAVRTNSCVAVFDGSTPSVGNGLTIQKDQNPWYLAVAKDFKVASTIAGNSAVDVLWLF